MPRRPTKVASRPVLSVNPSKLLLFWGNFFYFRKFLLQNLVNSKKLPNFASPFRNEAHMVTIAQLVRASDCGSEGRGFETH